jgi:hypothetical protein
MWFLLPPPSPLPEICSPKSLQVGPQQSDMYLFSQALTVVLLLNPFKIPSSIPSIFDFSPNASFSFGFSSSHQLFPFRTLLFHLNIAKIVKPLFRQSIRKATCLLMGFQLSLRKSLWKMLDSLAHFKARFPRSRRSFSCFCSKGCPEYYSEELLKSSFSSKTTVSTLYRSQWGKAISTYPLASVSSSSSLYRSSTVARILLSRSSPSQGNLDTEKPEFCKVF